MTFTSTAYLLFLPLVFFLYWLIQRNAKAQNFLLLAASYVFYGWWDSRLLSIIALMTLTTFYAAILVESSGNNNKMRRTVCGLGIVVCVATLVVFKFFNFFMTSASEFLNLFHIKFSPITLNIILPAGISFYTFQSISYLIDVYRRKLPATRNIITFATYIAFFPQLVAGPIERATRMIPILQGKRTFCYAQAVEGLRRIIIGLVKKMIIADNCAETVSGIFNSWNSQGSFVLIYGALLFTIEIYCDFSGYSDMAIGSAKLLGIELSENFRAPYLAKNIADFWRRWHITLMNWFKDYIYIPLGGKEHKTRNTAIVFLLSGLWHGANWTFVTWGLYNAGLFPFFRKLQKIRVPAFLMWLATFSCVVFGFMIFRSASITDAVGFITRMFSFTDLTAMPPSATKSLIALAGAGILFFAELKTGKANNITDIFRGMPRTTRRTLYIAIVSSIIIFGAAPAAFIYFQF